MGSRPCRCIVAPEAPDGLIQPVFSKEYRTRVLIALYGSGIFGNFQPRKPLRASILPVCSCYETIKRLPAHCHVHLAQFRRSPRCSMERGQTTPLQGFAQISRHCAGDHRPTSSRGKCLAGGAACHCPAGVARGAHRRGQGCHRPHQGHGCRTGQGTGADAAGTPNHPGAVVVGVFPSKPLAIHAAQPDGREAGR